MTGPSADFDVAVRRSPIRVAYYDRSLPADLVEMLWNQPEALVEMGEPLQLKDVRRTVRLEWASRSYVLKHYVEPTWRHALKHSFENSRAWRSWAATHKLADAGVATPRAVACIENPIGRWRRDSFMMYPYVEGQTLRWYFENRTADERIADFWRQLRELWRRLAQLRISLADTNIRNFIVCPAGRVWVIDLDKTRVHWTAYATARYHRRSWDRLVRSVELAKRRANSSHHRSLRRGGIAANPAAESL